jgi:hypothetical protein
VKLTQHAECQRKTPSMGRPNKGHIWTTISVNSFIDNLLGDIIGVPGNIDNINADEIAN